PLSLTFRLNPKNMTPALIWLPVPEQVRRKSSSPGCTTSPCFDCSTLNVILRCCEVLPDQMPWLMSRPEEPASATPPVARSSDNAISRLRIDVAFFIESLLPRGLLRIPPALAASLPQV